MTGLKNKNLILILIGVRDFFEKNPESRRPGPGNPINQVCCICLNKLL